MFNLIFGKHVFFLIEKKRVAFRLQSDMHSSTLKESQNCLPVSLNKKILKTKHNFGNFQAPSIIYLKNLNKIIIFGAWYKTRISEYKPKSFNKYLKKKKFIKWKTIGTFPFGITPRFHTTVLYYTTKTNKPFILSFGGEMPHFLLYKMLSHDSILIQNKKESNITAIKVCSRNL